ncbi:MAG: FAD binding domain-containing protein [Lysobacterales bacterium]
MTTAACFTLNGRAQDLAAADPAESLLRWLKRHHHTGTKEGCADGDCGACTVALVETAADGSSRYRAVNSCLMPLGLLPGREVLTVEALADPAAPAAGLLPAPQQLHPVQRALVDCAGSQCGYCTPGFVMSLFAGYYAREFDDAVTEGNLCRCTGYRPIRDAAAQLAAQAPGADRFTASLATPRPPLAAACLGAWHSPDRLDAALALKAAQPQAAWIAGGTDLGVALSHGQANAPAYIALDRIAALQAIEVGEDRVRIGACVPLREIETRLAGRYAPLDGMLPWFAARQVRNRATLGGNLGTASPIGDLLPVLLALDASVVCRSVRGERRLPIADYFLDYRRTARAEDELIVAVELSARLPGIGASYKVAKRQTDDISIVAASFVIDRDAQGRVRHARLAYGGVAATPRRALEAEAFLLGRSLDAATLEAVTALLLQAFTPLSDHRAGADYRRALCASLFTRFVAEHLA